MESLRPRGRRERGRAICPVRLTTDSMAGTGERRSGIEPRPICHNLNEQLKVALKRAGLRDCCTFHSLRHSAATMMLTAGVSAKVVADRLGHFSAGFTLDRYVHAVQGLDADAADRLQEFMNRGRRA